MIEKVSSNIVWNFIQDNVDTKTEFMPPPGDGLFFGYVENKELVGVIGYDKWGHFFRIKSHYVRRQDRGRGIGAILFNHVISKLENKPIFASASKFSIGFYERADFVVRKAYKNHIHVIRENL